MGAKPFLDIRYNEGGAIAPSSISDNLNAVRLLRFSDTDQVQELVDGAISALFDENYFAVRADTLTPEQAAQYFRNILGVAMTSLCDQVAECILTSDAVKAAINQVLVENGWQGGGGGTPTTPTNYVNNVGVIDSSGFVTCTEANIFAAITQLIDLLHGVILDAFEQIELSSNSLERIALIMRAIPVFGSLPIDEGIEELDNRLSVLAESYAAAYTLELRDTMRCELFCIARVACGLDFQQFADYFMSKVGAEITDNLFADTVGWLITGNYEGALVVYASHALVANVLAYGASFFDLDYQWMFRTASSFLNDQDFDYVTLCDCSGNFCYEVVPSAGAGWDIGNHTGGGAMGYFGTLGAYTNQNYDAFNTPHRAVRILLPIPSTANITRVEITVDVVELGYDARSLLYFQGSLIASGATVNTSGVTVHGVNGVWATNQLDITLYLSSNDNPMRGSAIIKNVRVIGTGTNPFGANC